MSRRFAFLIPAAVSSILCAQSAPTHIQMANVHFRYTPALTVDISGLDGSLLPTPNHEIVSFNDPSSFSIAIDGAEILMSAPQLEFLMNDWLLRSPKAQLKNLRITFEGQRLRIRGTMKKGIHIGFDASAEPEVTHDNRIRFSIRKIKAAGLPVKGLMDTLGLEMDNLVSQKGLNGMSVDENSFLIDPQSAFPAPHIRGKLAAVRIRGDELVITFGRGKPHAEHPPAKNFMQMRGGSLVYGRDTMADSDLTMIDTTPTDAFDFYLHDYWCQIVAGSIQAKSNRGWIIRVPDYAKLQRPACNSSKSGGY